MTDSAICVAVRSRPLLKNETQSIDSLSFEGNSTIHLQKKTFTFDYVFQPGVTNEAVYNAVVAEKIRPIFEGYNVTILAYGPTGSGKTYSMGTDYNPKTATNTDIGIIPRGISEIFRVIESQKDSVDFLVKVSFLELYREEIFDLLQKSKTACNLREDTDGIRVINLTEVPVESIEEAFVTLEKGSSLRHTSATAKNVKSSRSHAIFSVYIEQTDKQTFSFKRSKFQLVDLAGSERMSFSKTAGVQVKEGININLGLLSLGKVITHLIEEKQHIPYRDSKLTRLLQDSLGGNSHTVMIACVNPSAASVEETLSTLRYASNTRRIKNRPIVNVDPPALQIEKLKKQVETLQTALYQFQSRSGSSTYMPGIFGDGEGIRFQELTEQLQEAFSKISTLVDKLTKMEDKSGAVFENILSMYEKLKLLVAEMTTAADPNLKDYLLKLEEIQKECFNLTLSANLANFEYDVSTYSSGDTQSSLEESEESANPNPASETESNVIEEKTHEQIIRNTNLFNINRTLKLKYDQVKNMAAFYESYETNINQDYINSLINQIQVLVDEKSQLQERVESAKEKCQMESQQQIENYEKQISDLQKELRNKKLVLQAKEESQAKMNLLLTEIKDLKRAKVLMVKQMKQDSNKHIQKQREKEKEVAKLVREGRQKEHQLAKLQIKFDREVHVLKQKIDRIASVSKREMKKIGKTGLIKSKPTISQENLEDWIEEELKVRIDEKSSKYESQFLEADSEELKRQIIAMEGVLDVEDRERPSFLQQEINSQKAVIDIIDNRIKELLDSKDKSPATNLCPNLDVLNSMSQAKAVIEILFKKCVSRSVEADMQKAIFEETNKRQNIINDTNSRLINSIQHARKELQEEVNTNLLAHEKEMASLKYDHDCKIMHLLTELHLSLKDAAQDYPSLKEQVDNQEEELKELQSIREDYNHKCKEVTMLQQQLLQAKKGKKATWLGNITQESGSQSSSTSPEDKTTSVLEEYLSDTADESFGYDKTDPDWRLTPAYKREKAKKEGRKRHHVEEASQGSDSSSPKKKTLSYCRCRTSCKSNRCACRKYSIRCDHSKCGCDVNKCVNKDGEAHTLNEEVIVVEDVKKLSFEDD